MERADVTFTVIIILAMLLGAAVSSLMSEPADPPGPDDLDEGKSA